MNEKILTNYRRMRLCNCGCKLSITYAEDYIEIDKETFKTAHRPCIVSGLVEENCQLNAKG